MNTTATTIRRIYLLLLTGLLTGLLASCIPAVKPQEVEVSHIIPESAVVEQPEIAYNSSLPVWYLTVEPVRVRYAAKESSVEIDKRRIDQEHKATTQRLTITSTLYRSYLAERQDQITAQLNSSLLRVKNFKILDFEQAKQSGFSIPHRGEKSRGVYVVRVLITELEDRVEEDESSLQLPLVYTHKSFTYTGMVGLDVTVSDPKSGGRIVQSFPAQGSYHYKQLQNGGALSPYARSFEKAHSTIDNALRIALYEAAKETFRHLGEEK
jgi:hypothetical protein